VTLLFADTMMEDDDLYRFNRDVEKYLGIKITRIADGRNPWELFLDRKFMGSVQFDICSQTLKRDLLDKWIRKNAKPHDCTVYVGLDWTEQHRVDRMKNLCKEWKVEAPMSEEPYWDKPEMIRQLVKIGIREPILYSMGFPHNNCGGFCIKAGQAHFAHLLKMMPKRYAWHEHQEAMMRQKLGHFAILRDRRGGQNVPLTLETLRIRIATGEKFDRFEWGGCGCAIE